MIQRGCGAGYRAAQGQRGAAGEMVVACIIRDPRWDHQVEERSWLYAALVADLGVEPSRLRAAYAGPLDPQGDSDAWLATGVFERLARRGIDGCVSELRHYLRSGRDFSLALEHLMPFVDHPEAEGMLDDVLEVADDEELRYTVGWYRDLSTPPWSDWRCKSPRIERIAASVERARASSFRPESPRVARNAAQNEQMLRAAVASNLIPTISGPDPTGELSETTLLAIATELLQHGDGVVRAAASRNVRTLRSPLALAWARTNAGLDGSVGSVALGLIAELAEPSDGPWLLERLTEAVARDDIGGQCTLVPALGRAGAVAGTTMVDEIFDNTVYSYLRERCAGMLSRLAPDFAAERAVECLDDCESGTRAIAIAHADMSIPEVAERIGGIANDPSEEDDNRRAAAVRIMQQH